MESRKEWEALALSYWRSALPRLKDNPGRYRLDYHPGAYSLRGAEMEGWSRQLWALVPLIAGGGKVPEFDVILEGICAGVDPDSPHYWGAFGDYDQRMVECAAIGAALRMCPEAFWQPLTDRTQQQLVEFLQRINRFQPGDNNWLFFRVLVNCGLQHIGADAAEGIQQATLDRIESFVVEEPWYSDGPNKPIDYYNPTGFHFYGLLYSVWQKANDPDRALRLLQRAHRCAEAFIDWFDAEGAAIPYGRSLTYRFSQAALWSALAWAGGGPFEDGVLKGILQRHMQWWQSKPIHAADGTLTRGYGYPQDAMTEQYNSMGSPAWGFKIFWMLALPETHPFWAAAPKPLPAASPQPRHIRPARMLVGSPPDRSHAVAVSAGQEHPNYLRHAAQKYAKFAYSSQLAFAVPVATEPWQALAPDSTLLLRAESQQHWHCRDATTEFRYGDDWVESLWQPDTFARVRTRIYLRDGVQIRHHSIELDCPCELIEGGFAVAQTDDAAPMNLQGPHAGFLSDGKWKVSLQILEGSGTIEAAELSPCSHLMFPKAVLPVRRQVLPAGKHGWTTRVDAVQVGTTVHGSTATR